MDLWKSIEFIIMFGAPMTFWFALVSAKDRSKLAYIILSILFFVFLIWAEFLLYNLAQLAIQEGRHGAAIGSWVLMVMYIVFALGTLRAYRNNRRTA